MNSSHAHLKRHYIFSSFLMFKPSYWLMIFVRWTFSKFARHNSTLIVQAFPRSLKKQHNISIPNGFRNPHHLNPWPLDHCLLGTPLSCRAWDRGSSARLQAPAVRSAWNGSLSQYPHPPPPSAPPADWFTPPCLWMRACRVSSQVHARANIL